MHETLIIDEIDHKNTTVHMWVKCDNTNERKNKLDVIFNISDTHTKHEKKYCEWSFASMIDHMDKTLRGINCVHSSNSPY